MSLSPQAIQPESTWCLICLAGLAESPHLKKNGTLPGRRKMSGPYYNERALRIFKVERKLLYLGAIISLNDTY